MKKNSVSQECSIMKNIAKYLGSWIGVHSRTTTKRGGLWNYALVVATMLAGQAIGQTTYTWTNMVMAVQNWPDTGNWDGGSQYASDPANELRFFANTTTELPAVGTQTITNVPATLSMNTLTLNGKGKNTTPGSFIIVGNNSSTWTIGNGATSLVNLNTVYGGGGTEREIAFTIAPNLTLNQAVTTFTGNGTVRSGFTFTGNIGESAAGNGITKSGSHLLILSGINTYSGATTVSAGTLRLLNEFSLPGGMGLTGGTSALTISGTGVVELGAGNFQRNLGTGSSQFQITSISPNAVGFSTVGGLRVITVNNDASQELQWGSANFAPAKLTLNAATANNALWLANRIDLNTATRTVVVNANAAIISGDIRTASGTAGLTKEGAGMLVLSGSNTYNGTTKISVGTLSGGADNSLGDAAANLVFDGGTLRINGTSITNIASLGHAVTFTAAKAVGFDIADAANTFTVDQVLNQTSGGLYKDGAGTLVLNQDNTFSGATTATGGGTLVLDYSTYNGSKLALAALNLNGCNLVLRGGSHPETVGSIVILGGTGNSISRDGGSTATIANAGALTGSSNLTIAEAGIVSATTANAASGIQSLGRVTVGSDFATKDGSNLLQAYSAYTNATTAGGLTTATVNQLTGGGTMAATLNSYSLRIANSGNSDVLNLGVNNLTMINNGTVLYAGGFDNNYTINGTSGKVGVGSGNQSLNMNIFTGTLTVNANLAITGLGSLIKAGAGTLVVGGAHVSDSPTYIQQGVLRLANASGLGNTGGGTIVQGGAALELTNNITVGAEALSLSGSGISNGGALRNISGNNTYGGTVTVGGGVARINADSGKLTLSGGIVTSGGQNLAFGGAGNITVSNSVVVGAGNLIKDGSGTLEIVVTDNTKQWVCGDMTLNTSTLQLTFNVAPSATVPVIKVFGDLNVSGTPTIKIAGVVPNGVFYPLLTVGGSAPTSVPNLELASGIIGTLKWDGNTLFLTPSPAGSVILFK